MCIYISTTVIVSMSNIRITTLSEIQLKIKPLTIGDMLEILLYLGRLSRGKLPSQNHGENSFQSLNPNQTNF